MRTSGPTQAKRYVKLGPSGDCSKSCLDSSLNLESVNRTSMLYVMGWTFGRALVETRSDESKILSSVQKGSLYSSYLHSALRTLQLLILAVCDQGGVRQEQALVGSTFLKNSSAYSTLEKGMSVHKA